MQFYFLFLLPSSLFCCYQNLFSGPMSFASHFIFVPFFSAGSSAAGQQRGSKDINWPICMFQWASERKWHLQSFLFLGRERIIALHCFKAYQVTSKAFQHPFLAAGWWRRCSSALSLSLYWRYLSNLWSLYLDLTNSYWFSSSVLLAFASR